MNTASFKLRLFLLLAASFLLAGCPSAPPGEQTAATESAAEEPAGPAQVGPGNLTVTISSPVENQLYGVADPELTYEVTEGKDNVTVATDRIFVALHDIQNDERIETRDLGSPASGAQLPVVPDGTHELEFKVNDANGNPAVVVNLRYATDATDPDLVLIGPSDGLLTNDSTPRLEYTIGDDCFNTASCDEQVFVDDTDSDKRNGDDLDQLADGLHTVKVVYTDPAGHTAERSVSFTVDATPPSVVVEPPPPPPPAEPTEGEGGQGEGEQPAAPENDPIVESSTVNTEVGDLNFTSDENGQATVYLDPDETCEGLLLEGTIEDECAGFEIASVEFEEGTVTSVPVADLSYGEHVLVIVASDSLGNRSVQHITFTKADVTFPSVSVQEPLGLKSAFTVPLNFTATDDDTTQDILEVVLQLSVQLPNDGGWQDISPAGLDLDAGTLSVAADGVYLLVVSATDGFGNVTSVSAQFTVDTTPPTVVLSSPPNDEIVTSADPLLQYAQEEGYQEALQDEAVHLFAGLFSDEAVNPFTAVATRSGGLLHGNGGGGLPEGDHTVVVSLTDLAGNSNPVPSTGTATFTVNAVGPEVTLLDPEQGQVFAAGDVTVRYRAHEFTRVEVRKIATATGEEVVEHVREWNPDTPPDTIFADTVNFPDDGEYTIRLVAIDDTGTHPDAVAAITILVNSELPSVAITVPTEGDRYFRPDENIQLDYSVGNADSLVVSVDLRPVDGIDINSSTPVSLDLIPDEGTHSVSVSVTNNVGTSSDTESFVIDGTAPKVTIQSPAQDAFISKSSVTVLYSAIELNGIGKEVFTLDKANLKGFKNGDTILKLASGPHTLEVQVVDLAGNVSDTAFVSFTVDTTPPKVAIGSPYEGQILPTTTAKLLLKLGDNTDIARISVWLDGEEQPKIDKKISKNGITFSDLAQGDHKFEIEVEDLAGNVSELAVRNFIVDSLPPVVTIQRPKDKSTQQENSVVLEYSIEDGTGVASVEVRHNGTLIEGAKSGQVFTNLKSGQHTFSVQATDLAGHISYTVTTHVTIDSTAPVITITDPKQKAYLASTSVTLNYEVEESNGIAEETVWFDGEELSNAASGITLDDLSEGPHDFEVQVRDQVGNVSGKARVDFTLDVTLPEVIIKSPGDGETYEVTSVPLSYDIIEKYGISGQTVWLDGELLPGTYSGHTLYDLGYGAHYVEVRATDRAQNPSLVARVDFAVVKPPPPDTTPPEVTIYNPKPNEIYPFGTSLTLTFNVKEEGSGIANLNVVVDDEQRIGMKSGDTLGDLGPGPHYVEVSADDVAGNPGLATRVDFTIEEAPPEDEGTYIASKDAYLRHDRDDSNQGNSPKLIVGDVGGGRRAVVGFDLSEISAANVQSAVLVLTIDPSDPPSNWGPRGRTVDAHALLEEWTEDGVTWDCAIDANPANHHRDCKDKWKGGTYEEKPSAWVLHTTGMTGTVEFDVTDDVQNGITSWLLKKNHRGSGNVQYFSKEGASAAGDMSLAPTLVISGEPSDGVVPIVTIHGPKQHYKHNVSTAYVSYSVYAPYGIDKEEVWVNGEPLEIHGDGHHHGHRHWRHDWNHGKHHNWKRHVHLHWLRLGNLDAGEYTVAVQVTDKDGNKSELTEVTFSVRDHDQWKSGKVSCVHETLKDNDDDAEHGFIQAFKCLLKK